MNRPRAIMTWRGGHGFVSGSRVARSGGWNRHYGYGWRGYGWRGATVAGVGVGVGYGYPYYSEGYGYAYPHHSCWWYRHYDPAEAPSWCGYGYYGAPSYSYVYAPGPAYSYGYGSYGYRNGPYYNGGYRRHYVWTGSTGIWRHSGQGAGVSRTYYSHRVAMAPAHGAPFAAIPHGGAPMGARFAAIPHGGMHTGGHVHFVH